MALAALVVIVFVAAVFNVKVVSTADADAAATEGQLDPASYAADQFGTITDTIEAEAVPLPDLLTQLAGGADESEFGNTSGASSAFAFPVTFTGVAGAATPPVMPVTVEGIPPETTVQVQVGPALNGTALRDVTGEISFNEFTNQLEYQDVATQLNDLVRAEVLTDFDAVAAQGKTITVTGAFLRVNPQLVSVVPISIEVTQ
ncbi:DUF2291 family protein [Arthrobacter burdickii]|uniref:DUF2291 family protein n=1 Tax=Arthrobacter burdickii TaxID=3035920 RepID=A0ABT8JZW1_9MICC|nr:DUF2291 family protein [Arthrobacter burdickii]MDN4609887.1 DUF2291 family protein [Arthrobacter burdickii]